MDSIQKDSTLVLLSADLPELKRLLEAIKPDLRTLKLSPEEDAVDRISATLLDQPADRLVILCHGEPGQVYLGCEAINTKRVKHRSTSIAGWGVRRIDLYACNVAQDTAFIQTLAEVSDATVTGSTTLVGHKSLWGSWELTNSKTEETIFDHEILDQWVQVLQVSPSIFRATSANPGEAESISLYLVNQMRHAPTTWATLLEAVCKV